ncbi:GNAT family N-acetyltransferase [Streptomyces sp. NPDC001282]|uniref:GNAT family N-acetyltransferase n=1 Tax=Streptomyces sp. NPDC001282 TaxID=3364557 RepID=UPI00368A47E2
MPHERRATAPEADTLLLRPWLPDDMPDVIKAFRDPLMRTMLRAWVTDEAGAEHWLRRQQEGRESGTRFAFAVVDRASPGELVGNVAFSRLALDAASGEVGYWTAPWARGRGVARQALGALTDWVFEAFAEDGLVRLDLLHHVGNDASCRVAEECGYGLAEVLPTLPPWPREGHRHVRFRPGGAGRRAS